MAPFSKEQTQAWLDCYTPSSIQKAPFLELGARVWPKDRYQAFKICYQSMRWADDAIDLRRADPAPIRAEEKENLKNLIQQSMLEPGRLADPMLRRLHEIRQRYSLPLWPWRRWTQAMLYDLDHNGFASFLAYLRYSEGAAVAPGAIFMHLCGLRELDGRVMEPNFNVRRAARPLALFCYLVHILRDFQQDQLQNLNYFAESVLARHGLTSAHLRAIAAGGVVTKNFRECMHTYWRCADYYGRATRKTLNAVRACVAAPYALSLEIIYALYQGVFQRIQPAVSGFTTVETELPQPEILKIIHSTIQNT